MFRSSPTHVVAGTLVLQELSGHFERLLLAVDDVDDGGPVPVVVHRGPAPDTDAAPDDAAPDDFVRRRLALRTRLAGRGVPRVLAALIDDDGRPAGFIEEYAGAVSLARCNDAVRARQRGLPPIGVALRVACDVAVACAALGTERAWISSSDVLLGLDGRARMLLSSVTNNRAAAFRFLSPEHFGEQPVVNERARMFTFGVLLLELLTGEDPFDRAFDGFEVLMAIRNPSFPTLVAVRPDVPPALSHAVDRLLRREPADRFDDWRHVLAVLHDLSTRLPGGGHDNVAAFVDGLLPAERAAERAWRDALSRLDLPALRARLPHETGVHRRGALASVVASAADDDAWDEVTPPGIAVDHVGRDGLGARAVQIGTARWLVDVTPVTAACWARFCRETGRTPPPRWGGASTPPPGEAELPITGIDAWDARAYAQHYGKRLPDDELWQALVDALGPAALGVGATWEWTTTSRSDGWVVRGGRFRDRPGIPSDGLTRSWETDAAADVGFRCICLDGAATVDDVGSEPGSFPRRGRLGSALASSIDKARRALPAAPVPAEHDGEPGYDHLPGTAQWRGRRTPEKVDRATWKPCHACARDIPVRLDREAGSDDRQQTPPSTWSYVCPFCHAVQVGARECRVDPQLDCHVCEATLGDDDSLCTGCGTPRGWNVLGCPYCGHQQAICTPHLASGCDAFKFSCVRCECVYGSLCIC